MTVFYKNVSKKRLEKLEEEKDYYATIEMQSFGETKESYRLMKEFYSALIDAAKKHIRENSKQEKK